MSWPIGSAEGIQVGFGNHRIEHTNALAGAMNLGKDAMQEALLERVKEVSELYGSEFRGMLAHVVVGFKSPSRN